MSLRVEEKRMAEPTTQTSEPPSSSYPELVAKAQFKKGQVPWPDPNHFYEEEEMNTK
jgi:hypothetical protein